MKKSILILSLLALLSMTPTKRYSLTEGEAVLTFQALEVAKKAIPLSEHISAKDASNALVAIDSIQRVLYKQSIDTVKSKTK